MLLNNALWEVWNVRSETARNCSGFMSCLTSTSEGMTCSNIHETMKRVIPLWMAAAFEVHILQQEVIFPPLDRTRLLTFWFLKNEKSYFSLQEVEIPNILGGWDGEQDPVKTKSSTDSPLLMHPNNSRLGLVWLKKEEEGNSKEDCERSERIGSSSTQNATAHHKLDFDSKLSWGE